MVSGHTELLRQESLRVLDRRDSVAVRITGMGIVDLQKEVQDLGPAEDAAAAEGGAHGT